MDPSPSNAPTDRRRSLGAAGEDLATAALVAAGWDVLARNWRSPDPLVRGELDIVAIDVEDRALVFVEVKTRRSASAYGGPLAAVTHAKQAKLHQLGVSFLRETNTRARTIRFDVIGIVVDEAGRAADVQHVRAAF